MAEASDLPEPDTIEGAPHPRHARRLYGQVDAEAEVLAALGSGRLHHAWLIAGPRGVGKATLAWRVAAFLLSGAEPGLFGSVANLDTDPESAVRRRLRALSEPRLRLVRRGPDDSGEKLKTQIGAEEVRAVRDFLHLSVTDGGRRVVIVDSADELTAQGANALLKSLEEPPRDTVFLIVAHRPSALLPTIRSRCRTLRCQRLDESDLASSLADAGITVPPGEEGRLALLAQGSAGEAIRILNLGGLDLAARVESLFAAPRFDRQGALSLSEGLSGRQNEPKFDLLLTLIDGWLARLARAGVAGSDDDHLRRLAPTPRAGRGWAELQQTLSTRTRAGKAVNLDPGSLILDTLLAIEKAAGELALR